MIIETQLCICNNKHGQLLYFNIIKNVRKTVIIFSHKANLNFSLPVTIFKHYYSVNTKTVKKKVRYEGIKVELQVEKVTPIIISSHCCH